MMDLTDRNFVPKLEKDKDLPYTAGSVNLTRTDFVNGAEMWNRLIPDHSGMLYAQVDEQGIFAAVNDPYWVYRDSNLRFRNTKQGKTIKYQSWLVLRDRLTTGIGTEIETLTESMCDREITLHQWVKRMTKKITQGHCAAFMLGLGGYNRIRTSDIVELTDTIRRQLEWLFAFANEIASKNTNDNVSKERIKTWTLYTPPPMKRKGVINRSKLYSDAMTQSSERGKYRSVTYRNFNEPLPAYPGDGSTRCTIRCKCHWRIDNNTGDLSYINCYWKLRALAKHCVTCINRSIHWNPLVVWRF